MHLPFHYALTLLHRLLLRFELFPSSALFRFDLIRPPLCDVFRSEVTESQLRHFFDDPAGAEVNDHGRCEADFEAPLEGHETEFLLSCISASLQNEGEEVDGRLTLSSGMNSVAPAKATPVTSKIP